MRRSTQRPRCQKFFSCEGLQATPVSKFEKPALGTRAKKLTRLTTPDCYHQGLLHLQSIAQQACYPSVSVGKKLLPATMSKKRDNNSKHKLQSCSCNCTTVCPKNFHKANTSQTGKCILEHTSDLNRFAQQPKSQAGRGTSRRKPAL